MVPPDRDQFSRGDVEVDETYLGQEEPGIKGRRTISRAIVIIAVEMNEGKIGCIRFRHVPNVNATSLHSGLHRRRRQTRQPHPHRPPAGLRQHRHEGLPTSRYGDQDVVRAGPHSLLRCPSCRVAPQALVPGHASRRHQQGAPALLPRRVHLPLQPPHVEGSRAALLPAHHAGRSHSPHRHGRALRGHWSRSPLPGRGQFPRVAVGGAKRIPLSLDTRHI